MPDRTCWCFKSELEVTVCREMYGVGQIAHFKFSEALYCENLRLGGGCPKIKLRSYFAMGF